jgi:hypothetical protein
VKQSVKKTWLVHGEEKSAMSLMELLSAQRMREVHYPDLHDTDEI